MNQHCSQIHTWIVSVVSDGKNQKNTDGADVVFSNKGWDYSSREYLIKSTSPVHGPYIVGPYSNQAFKLTQIILKTS